jgi:cytochrome c oxidase assembly factor CtaG
MTWPFDPTVYAGLVGMLLGYGWLARERLDRDRRPLLFLAGVAILWLALESPIDTIGEQYLGSVHMIQHVMLGMAAPPLLLLGLSPRMARLLLDRVPGLRWATRPVVAQVLAGSMWIAWHLPWLYDLTTSNLQVHVFEHLLFIASGLLLFWPAIEATASTLPEPMSDGWRMLYLALATIPQDGVALALQFSSTVFYAQYRTIPHLAPGYTPVVDQTVSGVVMMLGANFVMGAILLAVFFRWLGREERRQRREDAEPEQQSDMAAWLARVGRR